MSQSLTTGLNQYNQSNGNLLQNQLSRYSTVESATHNQVGIQNNSLAYRQQKNSNFSEYGSNKELTQQRSQRENMVIDHNIEDRMGSQELENIVLKQIRNTNEKWIRNNSQCSQSPIKNPNAVRENSEAQLSFTNYSLLTNSNFNTFNNNQNNTNYNNHTNNSNSLQYSNNNSQFINKNFNQNEIDQMEHNNTRPSQIYQNKMGVDQRYQEINCIQGVNDKESFLSPSFNNQNEENLLNNRPVAEFVSEANRTLNQIVSNQNTIPSSSNLTTQIVKNNQLANQENDEPFFIRETFGDQLNFKNTLANDSVNSGSNTIPRNQLNASSSSLITQNNFSVQNNLPPQILLNKSLQDSCEGLGSRSQNLLEGGNTLQIKQNEGEKREPNLNQNVNNSNMGNSTFIRPNRASETNNGFNISTDRDQTGRDSIRSNSPSGSIAWNDSNSPAIAGAIKSLQEQNQQLEGELSIIKVAMAEKEKQFKQEITQLKEANEKEINQQRNKDSNMKNQFFQLNQESSRMQCELNRLQNDKKRIEKENEFLKSELDKIQFEFSDFNQEVIYLKKCNEILEDEKRKHIEQNCIEKEEYEQQIHTFQKLRAAEKALISKLEQDNAQNAQAQTSWEEKAIQIENQFHVHQKNFNQFKQEVSSREKDLINQLQSRVRDLEDAKEQLERERAINQKQQTTMGNVQDKLSMTKDENSDLRKEIKTLHIEITHLKQTLESSEKNLKKTETEKKNYQEIVKQLKSINEQIAQKVNKEVSNKYIKENLASLFSRSRKIDDIISQQEKPRENSKLKTSTSSGHKSGKKKNKSRNNSQSPNRSSSKSHTRIYSKPGLDLDDLIDSPNLSQDMMFQQSMKPRYVMSNNQNHSIGNISQTQSDGQTPKAYGQQYLISSSQKKSSLQKFNKSGDQSQSLDKNRSLSRSRPSESEILHKQSIDTDTSRTLSEFNTLQLGESYGKQNHLLSERTTNEQISNQIFRLERLTTDLQREYSNIQNKMDYDAGDDTDGLRARMNQIATDLQNKTQELIALKQKQKELIFSKVKSD